VYAYQGSSKFDDGTTTLLNNFQFRNNFHKNINTEKAKFGLGSCTDDEDECKGKAYLLTIKKEFTQLLHQFVCLGAYGLQLEPEEQGRRYGKSKLECVSQH